MSDFAALGLSQALCRALTAYAAPTPVQEAAIPAIVRGEDVRASAQTGSGKTAAFVLPLLQQLVTRPREHGAVYALVIAPTRELAEQIAQAVGKYAVHLTLPLKVCVITGGSAANP